MKMRKKSLTFALFILYSLFLVLYFVGEAIAGPASSSFELKNYSFGAGGDSGLTSNNFKAMGVLGQIDSGVIYSSSFKAQTGLIFEIKAPPPPAPTFTNPATNYDRLLIKINAGSNKTDATYAVAISTDNFATDTRYVKSDFTIGATLVASDFQSLSAWGGTNGVFITGLMPHTTYYAKVKARQGNYTESEYGEVASIATSDPSLTFGLDTYIINFNNLNAGNSYTDSTQQTTLTTSTNAYNGYIVWANEDQKLTYSSATIDNYGAANDTPTSWSGTGFGYSSSDSDLQTGPGSASRFSGSKYAGFRITPNQDPVADHTAKIENPTLNNENFIISYRVTTPSDIEAGTYRNTIMYTVVPIY
jgi:hypothetical protein